MSASAWPRGYREMAEFEGSAAHGTAVAPMRPITAEEEMPKMGSRCGLVGAPSTGALLVAATCFASVAAAQPPEVERVKEGAAVPASVEVPTRHGSAFVDPLGLALFGPRLGVEAGGGHFSGALHARWFNGGLLSHSLFAKGDDELGFGYGVGLRARYYIPDGLEGLHLGVLAEYLHSRVENRPALIGTTSSYVVPYAEVGYRFAFGRLYADGSAGVGYALRMSSEIENLPGGSSAGAYTATDESSVYGTASLELGVLF